MPVYQFQHIPAASPEHIMWPRSAERRPTALSENRAGRAPNGFAAAAAGHVPRHLRPARQGTCGAASKTAHGNEHALPPRSSRAAMNIRRRREHNGEAERRSLCLPLLYSPADVAELADARDLKSRGFGRVGSSPTVGTTMSMSSGIHRVSRRKLRKLRLLDV